MKYPIFHRITSAKIPYAMILVIIMALFVVRAYAQDATPDVTADQVNSIAAQMYCPVCENIPLDVCPTDACAQWREEIRSQLQAGRTSDQIINDFVTRYGDRVVGVPQNPLLRGLSLITPGLIALIAIGIAIRLFIYWIKRKSASLADGSKPAYTASSDPTDEDYRARLERDLQARR